MSFLTEVIRGGAVAVKAPPREAMPVHVLTNRGGLIKYANYNFGEASFIPY
jgi:hypothetical protein